MGDRRVPEQNLTLNSDHYILAVSYERGDPAQGRFLMREVTLSKTKMQVLPGGGSGGQARPRAESRARGRPRHSGIQVSF